MASMAESFFVFELQLSAILKYAVKSGLADKNRNGLEVLVIVFDRFLVRNPLELIDIFLFLVDLLSEPGTSF